MATHPSTKLSASAAITSSALAGGSGLRVGQSALRFGRTHPGEESFLILKVTPSRPNTPITLLTDVPDQFRVAVGVDRLVFQSELTFTPDPQGTYVHVRYTPRRNGRHEGELTVQSPDEMLTVALTGYTGGISGKRLASFLAGTLIVGLGYAGYAYRCQIWPDGCSPFSASESVVQDPPADTPLAPVTPPTEPLRNVPAPRSAGTATIRDEPEVKPTTRIARRSKSTLASPRPEPAADVRREARNQRVETAATDAKPATTRRREEDKLERPVRETPAPRASAPQLAKAVQEKPAKKPTAKPKPTPKPSNEESELERLLNGTSNQ